MGQAKGEKTGCKVQIEASAKLLYPSTKEAVILPETERQSLIMARRGQGLFRERVAKIEKCCRLTRVDRPCHLVASHTKPWRDCGNEERLEHFK